MKITRRGSSADHGSSSVELKEPKISWDSENTCIKCCQNSIGDFSTYAKHDYTVSISLSEIKSILSVIGEKPVNDLPEIISSAFTPILRPLLRILSICVGKIGVLGGDPESNTCGGSETPLNF